ncbi:MAG TPA: endo-1,4-beta-xylanase, partial [Geminicoccaceae bacterium]|nr:endo-1,4-beta-xylanase [Geminicoccaceae bacterium]
MIRWSRRAVLRGAAAGGIAVGTSGAARSGSAQNVRDAPCDATVVARGEDVPSLGALTARQGRRFGCAVKDQLFTDAPFRQLVAEQCNILVCTYSMKWRHVEREPGRFNFR